MQKLRLAWRGWARRREQAQSEFLAKNASWAHPPPLTPAPLPASGARGNDVDLEGLQVAYLDDSGRINYYLDTDSGEVVEARHGETNAETYAEPRYRRVPRRSAASDAADRREFVATLEDSPLKNALRAARDPAEFRRVLSENRKLERGWYVFKNDRATAAIDAWLKPRG